MHISLIKRVLHLFPRIMINNIDRLYLYVVMPFDDLFVLALCTSDEDRSSLTFNQSLI